MANELSPNFNNANLNNIYELGNFDSKKAAPPELPYPENEEIFNKYYFGSNFKTLEEAQFFYETKVLNNSEFKTKNQKLLDKYLIYDSTGKWPVDMRSPYSDFVSKPGESRIQEDMRRKEELFLQEKYLFYHIVKKSEEDLQLYKALDNLQDDINYIKITSDIERQEKLESEKAYIEENGLANFWIKTLKEKMQETGILADERTIIIRENFFKSNDWISEMMKMSPQPDWVPEQIALIEEQRKWLEENDPLFSNNELIAWLNKTSSSDYIIDPELIASILETLGVGTTEIVSETPVIVESNESGNGWTNPTDSNEIVIPNDEDNTPARVGQVKYDGYLTNIYGMRMEPFWFDIDFTSGTFSRLWIFHGEGPIVAWEIDENGIRIPGSEYQLSVKFESIGEVSGKIDSC